MAKMQNDGSQPSKKNTGVSLGDGIWTGAFKESPAYKKVMTKKAKEDASVAAYAKKAAAEKAAAIVKAKKKP